MTRILKRKRLLSLVLALSLLITLMPPLSIPGYSEELTDNAELATSDSGLNNYGAAIGAVAQWNYVTSVLLASNHFESKGDVCAGVSVNALPKKLAIVDYAYNDANAVLWYKVDAAPGYTWPEEYANYHWVDSYTIRIVSQNGMTGVFDADGNAVTELSMGVYDTPVLAAESSLQGSVAYQWQIEYETGKWADIYGENEKELTVTIGMLASLLDGNKTAKLRCVSRAAAKSAVSTAIAVTVTESTGGDDAETTEPSDPPVSSDYVNITVDGVQTNQTTIAYDDYDADNNPIEDGEKVVESQQLVVTINEKPASNVSLRALDRSASATEGVATAAPVNEYTVTITYKYENGKQAYEYFIGEVSPGVNLTNTVTFPVIPGYEPWLNGKQVDSLKLNVIGSEVTADILYEVVYKPALVNVTVVIEHQNIYDDGYKPVATKVIQRLTGSYIETITEFADKYPGFYQLEHSKPEVAADGSTTVTIKFNRLYYLMRFDLGDGGYGVQPVYARYGTEVEVPKPQRPGYIFLNWKSYDGSTVKAADGMAKFAMPASSCTVTAIWEATKVNYTIVYWKENADPNADGTYGYSYWTSKVVPARAGDIVSGGNTVAALVDDEDYFTYNDARTDKNVVVQGDSSTVVNVYYTRNSYSIFFKGGKGEDNYKYQKLSGTCVLKPHTHGDGKCESYLICGNETHTHTDSCYSQCTIPEHTHTKKEPNCDSAQDENNVIYVITAKYEATIGLSWPTAGKFPNVTFRGWLIDGLGSTTQVSKRINMTTDLCDTSDGVKNAKAVIGGTKTYLYYMFESFDQTSPANGDERKKLYGTYYDKSELYYQEVNSGSTTWHQKEIMGMSAVEGGVKTDGSKRFLYYDRLRFTIEFQNIDKVIHTENQVVFEKPLNYYLDEDGNYIDTIIPDYPEGKEAGAYEFAGWYTTPECFEGTKFDFATGTMPNGDLKLFAKWAPVKHNVTFYTSKNSATGELKGKIGDTVAVPHGSKINEQYIPQAPEDFKNGQYTFDGWFYMDHGVEKAFSFEDMTVNQELNVYARWISNKQINYIFHFELADGTVIADPVTGSGLAGETITVNAKGDTALYAGYQEGYFPNFKSHSIDLDIEAKDGLMKYTFKYTFVDAVPYKVYYVAEKLKEGGTSLGTIVRDGKTYYIIAATDEHNQNRKAYVVEQFKPVSGYLPDAYQKSSPIANGGINEIIFYYTVDSTRAYYKVTHYIQNLDGASWTEYRVNQSQGTIGSVYSADPLDIPGYTYNSTIPGTLTSGKLTEGGLELKLYYVRNKYPYKVVYKVQETGEVLYDSSADGTIETDFYEKIIFHKAPEEHGIYDLVGNATQTFNIRIEADLTNPTLNVITFYYAEREVDLTYKLVGPDGTVYDVNQTWGGLTSFGESVKVSIGKANGSTASANSNVYKFLGWYSDPECTNRVTDKLTFVPTKADGTLGETGTTYYAKFAYNLTSLTIQKQGHDSIDENQTFLFEITDEDGFKLTVTVHGNGAVTVDGLAVGKQYTIVEITDWSWRYTNIGVVKDSTTVMLSDSSISNGASFSLNATENVITFANTRSNLYWLDGDSWCNNIFK